MIVDSVNSADVTGKPNAGGIVGSSNGDVSFTNCSVEGTVTVSANDIVGGIIGNAGGSSCVITSCSVSPEIGLDTESDRLVSTDEKNTSNQDTVWNGAVRGIAVGMARETRLIVDSMTDEGFEPGKYELVADIYSNGGTSESYTLRNCTTEGMMTWMNNSGSINLILIGSSIGEIVQNGRSLKITSDATSTVNNLVAGAKYDHDVMMSSDYKTKINNASIKIASGSVLNVGSYEIFNEGSEDWKFSGSFCGEDATASIIMTENGETILKSWNPTSNEWGSGSTGLNGTGVEDDPIIIGSYEDLQKLRENVNNGYSYAGLYIRLDTNITITDGTWTPIGTVDKPFSGRFDGNGHTISGLAIPSSTGGNVDVYLGLFGCVKGQPNMYYDSTEKLYDDSGFRGSISEDDYSAVIKDLTLSGFKITASGSKVGALAGETWDAYISNISVDGESSIVGTNSIGGIIGRGYGTYITNCDTAKDVNVSTGNNETDEVYNIGGIAGSLRASPKEGPYLSAVVGCTNNAVVDAYLSAGGMAGIVGQIPSGDPIVIYDCHNTGAITITGHGTVDDAYTAVAGGIAGQNPGDRTNVIANCSNSGKVSGGSEGSPVGALAGIANYYTGSVIDCSNSGEISGHAHFSAGIVGHGGNVEVISCENSGGISNSYSGGFCSTHCAGTTTTTYRDMVFEDISELESSLVKAAKKSSELVNQGASLYLENVTVQDDSGTLQLPQFLSVLISDESLCEKLTISGDRSSSNNISVGIPECDVTVASDAAFGDNGRVTITSDGMVLRNNSTIGQVIVNGDDVTVYNQGTVTGLTSIDGRTAQAGDRLVVYNGTESYRDAKMSYIQVQGIDNRIYNYGTIDRSGTGHALSFGSASPVDGRNDTTVIFDNFGTVIGGSTNGNYVIYAPGATHIALTNHEGSVMKQGQGGNWYIFYGLDGYPRTTGTPSEKGVFDFRYRHGTVQDPSGTAVTPIENNFVGVGDTDRKINIIAQYEVVFRDGSGRNIDVIVDSGSTVPSSSIPTFAKTGYTMTGWTSNGGVWTVTTPVTANMTIDATWRMDAPTVETDSSYGTDIPEGGHTTLTATASHTLNATFSYQWSKDGVELPNATQSTLEVSSSGSYSVSVTATYGSDSSSATGPVIAVTVFEPEKPLPTDKIDESGDSKTLEGDSEIIIESTDKHEDVTINAEIGEVKLTVQGSSEKGYVRFKAEVLTDPESVLPSAEAGIDIEIKNFDIDDEKGMIVSIPVIVSSNKDVEAILVYYLDEINDELVPIGNGTLSNGEISFWTNHNTIYVIDIQYEETTFIPLPDRGDGGVEVIPPEQPSNDDESAKVLACAAAAVFAAILAVYIMYDFKKK
ncbi:hypothetical protein [Candidatus Methanoprimaticola sp. MG2]|uniref:hypothetical protein n=1 Tax=Candidatus Methanoprimaticola sp. MG2 TaxID=3228838 RepID=UPI0039C6C49A